MYTKNEFRNYLGSLKYITLGFSKGFLKGVPLSFQWKNFDLNISLYETCK